MEKPRTPSQFKFLVYSILAADREGYVVGSVRQLADKYHMARSDVHRREQDLIADGTISPNKKGYIINNYQLYQGKSVPNKGHSIVPPEGQSVSNKGQTVPNIGQSVPNNGQTSVPYMGQDTNNKNTFAKEIIEDPQKEKNLYKKVEEGPTPAEKDILNVF